ncbi:MAG TPA: hypothetical protein DIC23_09755, partial [Planctomycetaceae bacterium]|nr:hypothetical protein [Planctomycetaceae bacterium]
MWLVVVVVLSAWPGRSQGAAPTLTRLYPAGGQRGATVVEGPERGSVSFESVWFAYAREDWVLRDVSLRIEPGETVAIVGAS